MLMNICPSDEHAAFHASMNAACSPSGAFLSHPKPVTNAPYSLYVLWIRCVKFNLLSDLLDMNSNRGYISYAVHIPYLAEQLILGKYLVWVAGKEAQYIELLIRKYLLLVINIHSSVRLVYLKTSDLDDVILECR